MNPSGDPYNTKINLDMDDQPPTYNTLSSTTDRSKNSKTYQQVINEAFKGDVELYKTTIGKGFKFLENNTFCMMVLVIIQLITALVYFGLSKSRTQSLIFVVPVVINALLVTFNFVKACILKSKGEKDIYDRSTNKALIIIAVLGIVCVCLSFTSAGLSILYIILAKRNGVKRKFLWLVWNYFGFGISLTFYTTRFVFKAFARKGHNRDAQGRRIKGLDFFGMPLSRNHEEVTHSQ